MLKRTTLLMEDHLLKQVKKVAIDQNRSLKQITEEALWYYLDHRPFQQQDNIHHRNRLSFLRGSLKGTRFSQKDFKEVEKELFG